MEILFKLFFTFAYLDIISFGGAASMIPEMERQVVIVNGWMTHQEFFQAVALGFLVPGPNMLYVLHIGNHVAGWQGALAAGFGMFGPTCLLLAGVASLAGKAHPPAWIKQFHAACSPVTIGLMASAAWSLGQNLVGDIFYLIVCLLVAVLNARGLLSPAKSVILAVALGLLHTLI
ncbi:MAG: chromate transporter [Symploca sp. SIO3C6]|uniref:Chromate transporter n=1 Tax=Symploca sp. SIO1C4 TaxID=2607765 RepID=A0A6B3N5Q2_9CYAN|nr:chromate transporter [Symploca sp. SIO3C6]NER29076.1 chromate transporter [Symploca sp. SIO1C4]NET03843.1 chromate transporter [Symploca sp. SIO2B6]NET53881.1 chromate transporter [Merismopedia sp. SIO2A8]